MISLSYDPAPQGLTGSTWAGINAFYNPSDPIRQVERASIRAFMENHREYLRGRVLDFGCGNQPYRDLVDGEYVGYEKGDPGPGGYFDAVMWNQVIQYLENPLERLKWQASAMLRAGGHLVMTYPCCWAEVEADDYWRFTKAGMERLLQEAGFQIVAHELRAEVVIRDFRFPLGYGVIARR